MMETLKCLGFLFALPWIIIGIAVLSGLLVSVIFAPLAFVIMLLCHKGDVGKMAEHEFGFRRK